MFIPRSKKCAKVCAAVSLSAVMLFSTPSLASAASLLKLGVRGDQVKEVQTQLKDLGFFGNTNITGYYGDITLNAVKKFQASKGISQDGIVGSNTRKYLFNQASGSNTSTQGSSSLLKLGSRGSSVTQLQQTLKNKGFLNGSADGIFGNMTHSAVTSFQKAAKISADGIVGAGTWAALEGQVSSSGSSSSDNSTSSSGSLKQGHRGSRVTTLQQRLKDLGYLSGSADGIFGPATRRAVVSFQKDNGLTTDGIAGAKTIAKLDNPAKKGSGSSTDSDRGSSKGQDVVNYAMKFLGYAYQYGSQGPNSFDCSGFTHYVYKQFGINISASSVAQRSVGTAVSKSDLKLGDLVCFKNGNHVGIYIGGGNFIHASTYKTGVKISNLNDGKYPQRYVTARRLLK
ncbi:MAG TPA: peptidoglycan-binding protein [Clostridia bacterium]|nr:peptidoglycan-binding protein [Clostridia bacterium]